MSDSSGFDTPQVLSERYGPNYRWFVTVTGMVGVVSMVLAMTTVNVAVPDVMGAFGIGQDQAQWMSSAYAAAMTAGMLMNAWITGVLGERRTFVGALFFFSIGALFGALFLGILRDGLVLEGVNADYLDFILGVAILVAMIINVYVGRVRRGSGV